MDVLPLKVFSRWVVEPSLAVLVTLGLFLLMAYLITPTGSVPDSIEGDPSIQITRTKRDEISEKRNRVIPDKPEIENIPPPPVIPQTRPAISSNSDAFYAPLPEANMGSNNFENNNDRRATPMVRIPPQYPQSQISRGQEGWVLVEFTITPTGTTANAVVIDAEPKNVFDRAVLRAIKRWKYQPKVVGGKAVAQHNMREVFRFELEDS